MTLKITRYWSAKCGKFVNKDTGVEQELNTGPDPIKFLGTQSEWNEMLNHVIGDAAANCDTDGLGPGLTAKLFVSPAVLKILQASVGFRPASGRDKSVSGTLDGKFTVVLDAAKANNDIDFNLCLNVGKVVVLDV